MTTQNVSFPDGLLDVTYREIQSDFYKGTLKCPVGRWNVGHPVAVQIDVNQINIWDPADKDKDNMYGASISLVCDMSTIVIYNE